MKKGQKVAFHSPRIMGEVIGKTPDLPGFYTIKVYHCGRYITYDVQEKELTPLS